MYPNSPRMRTLHSTHIVCDLDLQKTRTSVMHRFDDVELRVDFYVQPATPGNRIDPPEPAGIEFTRVIALTDCKCASELCDGAITVGADLTNELSVRDFDLIDRIIMRELDRRMAERAEREREYDD